MFPVWSLGAFGDRLWYRDLCQRVGADCWVLEGHLTRVRIFWSTRLTHLSNPSMLRIYSHYFKSNSEYYVFPDITTNFDISKFQVFSLMYSYRLKCHKSFEKCFQIHNLFSLIIERITKMYIFWRGEFISFESSIIHDGVWTHLLNCFACMICRRMQRKRLLSPKCHYFQTS